MACAPCLIFHGERLAGSAAPYADLDLRVARVLPSVLLELQAALASAPASDSGSGGVAVRRALAEQCRAEDLAVVRHWLQRLERATATDREGSAYAALEMW